MTGLRTCLVSVVVILAVLLKFLIRAPEPENLPLFDICKFNPGERFDLSNMKYSWTFFGLFVILASLCIV